MTTETTKKGYKRNNIWLWLCTAIVCIPSGYGLITTISGFTQTYTSEIGNRLEGVALLAVFAVLFFGMAGYFIACLRNPVVDRSSLDYINDMKMDMRVGAGRGPGGAI